MPTTIITVMARIRSALSSNSRKTSELVIGAIAAAAMPSAGAQRDELAGRGDEDDAQAQQAEHGEPDQQDAPASQAVGDRSGGEQQAAERQRVRAGDPLQRGRAARRGRDRSWAARSTAACCRPSRRRTRGRGRPAGSTPRAASCRCVTACASRQWRSWSWPQHRRGPLAAPAHGAHTALASLEFALIEPLERGEGGGDDAGSNCVPAQRWSSASASSGVRPAR